LPNGTSLNVNDSTSNGNNLTDVTTATATTTGQIDGAANFSGSQYLKKTSPLNLPSGAGAMTLCGWAKPSAHDSTYRAAAAWGVNVGGQAFAFYNHNGDLMGGGAGTSYSLTQSGWWTDNIWGFVCVSYDGTNVRLYGNGSLLQGPTLKSLNVASAPLFVGLSQADTGGGEYWKGVIDEVRISNIARSADWIKTEYNNQYSPQTFYTMTGVSNAQTRPAGIPLLKSRGGVRFH
jgi:hypothetical protein